MYTVNLYMWTPLYEDNLVNQDTCTSPKRPFSTLINPSNRTTSIIKTQINGPKHVCILRFHCIPARAWGRGNRFPNQPISEVV